MPKRPGRERNLEYDRNGRIVTGVTTSDSLFELDEEDDNDNDEALEEPLDNAE